MISMVMMSMVVIVADDNYVGTKLMMIMMMMSMVVIVADAIDREG